MGAYYAKTGIASDSQNEGGLRKAYTKLTQSLYTGYLKQNLHNNNSKLEKVYTKLIRSIYKLTQSLYKLTHSLYKDYAKFTQSLRIS